MRRSSHPTWLSLPALAVAAAFATGPAAAQVSIDMDVRGFLCRKPADAKDFQHLAATRPEMPRAAALWRFNRTRQQPRCRWYERTHMIFKGALRNEGDDSLSRTKHLFIGGDGGVFEVLVYETPDGAQTLYSWRRTFDTSG